MRFAVNVGAHIYKNRGSECGTIDTGQTSEDHSCGRHGGAGVAGSYESISPSLADETQADANRGIPLGADSFHFVVHGDDFTGMDDVDFEPPGARIARQFSFELRLGSNQEYARAMMARRLQRPFDFGLGRFVGSHRIQSDYARHGGKKLGLLFDLEDFAALVVSAFRAGAMRHLLFMTVGTLGKRMPGQKIVCAAF